MRTIRPTRTPETLYAYYRAVDPESDVTLAQIRTWTPRQQAHAWDLLDAIAAEQADAAKRASDRVSHGSRR